MEEIAHQTSFVIAKIFDEYDTTRRGMLNKQETEAFVIETMAMGTKDVCHNAFPELFSQFGQDGTGYIGKQ